MTRLGGGRIGSTAGVGEGGAPPPGDVTVEGTTNLTGVQFDVLFNALESGVDLPNLQAKSEFTELESSIDFPDVQLDARFDLDLETDLPNAQADVAFTALDAESDLPNAQAKTEFTELESSIDLPNAQAETRFDLDLEADLPNAQAKSELTELESGIDLPSAQADIAFNALDAAIDLPNAQAKTEHTELESSIDLPNAQAKFQSVTVEMQQNLAEKDSFVPFARTVGNCNDDANKNGQDLFVSNVALQNDARAFIGWDLSGLPTGIDDATIIPTLRLKPSINANLVAVGRGFAHIANADEGWNEADIKCSTAPAPGADFMTANNPTGTGEWALSLDEDASLRISQRMGVGFYTVVVRDVQAGGASITYESKDQGTNDDLGPRLSIQFDMVL